MRCPECGVEVNVETSRCHSCGVLLHQPVEESPTKLEEIGKATKRTVPFLSLIGFLLLLLFITYPIYTVFESRQKSERLKENLELIMDNLKEYAKEHNGFPTDVQLLIDEGFITAFPENPYHKRIMKHRAPGQSFAGDFTYVPLLKDRGRIRMCVLVGYGPDLEKGQDVFTDGSDYSSFSLFIPDPDGKPDGVIHIITADLGEYQV